MGDKVINYLIDRGFFELGIIGIIGLVGGNIIDDSNFMLSSIICYFFGYVFIVFFMIKVIVYFLEKSLNKSLLIILKSQSKEYDDKEAISFAEREVERLKIIEAVKIAKSKKITAMAISKKLGYKSRGTLSEVLSGKRTPSIQRSSIILTTINDLIKEKESI